MRMITLQPLTWFGIVFALTATFALANRATGEKDTAISGAIQVEGSSDEVVIYIERAPIAATPKDRAEMSQRNTTFVPGALVVSQGQVVDFPNQDKFYHNVFSLSPRNEFDLGLYRSGVSKSARMNEPGEVNVYCNIHPTMVAKILVVQNPYYTVASPDGRYRLERVPPGHYTLVAWSPAHIAEKRTIEVKAGGQLVVDFSLRPRPRESHLNKSGEQYGRYK